MLCCAVLFSVYVIFSSRMIWQTTYNYCSLITYTIKVEISSWKFHIIRFLFYCLPSLFPLESYVLHAKCQIGAASHWWTKCMKTLSCHFFFQFVILSFDHNQRMINQKINVSNDIECVCMYQREIWNFDTFSIKITFSSVNTVQICTQILSLSKNRIVGNVQFFFYFNLWIKNKVCCSMCHMNSE